MDTKCLLCQIQPRVVFKLNHDPLGPEENAGDAIHRDVERAGVAVGEWPPGHSFPLFFPAHVVADNLIDHIKYQYQKTHISGVTLHPTRINDASTWRASVEPALSRSSTEHRKQRILPPWEWHHTDL